MAFTVLPERETGIRLALILGVGVVLCGGNVIASIMLGGGSPKLELGEMKRTMSMSANLETSGIPPEARAAWIGAIQAPVARCGADIVLSRERSVGTNGVSDVLTIEWPLASAEDASSPESLARQACVSAALAATQAPPSAEGGTPAP